VKSFLVGRKSLETQALRAAHGHHTALQIAGVVKPAPTASNVEVIKQGDKVVRLVIKCSCGELIEIECLYPAGS
jgi:hypothetical protein